MTTEKVKLALRDRIVQIENEMENISDDQAAWTFQLRIDILEDIRQVIKNADEPAFVLLGYKGAYK